MLAPSEAQASAEALKADIAERFAEMRGRTLDLVAPLSDEDLRKVHEPTMGPVDWDLAHIPYFEELWLVHGVRGSEAQRRFYDDKMDAELQPRPTRDKLGLPPRDELVARMRASRAAMLATLREIDLDATELTRGGFAHEMILQHEAQHQENMLVTIQLIPGRYEPAIRLEKPAPSVKVEGMALVEGGPFEMGADLAPGVYDNEAPRHEVDVPPFVIDRSPVTNAEYLRFLDAGGYDDESFWSEDGWDMRTVHRWRHPKAWTQDEGGRWWSREMDRTFPLPLDQPVIHVSWYEAEAFAAWARKRLPTEAEWEKAATWDPKSGAKRRFPWGDAPWTPERANLDQRLFGPAPVGAYPEGASANGCHQMVGDAWEWTSSDLTAYPSFRAYPYDKYSRPYFDRGFKVLRGGSWATRSSVARGTFRNWHQMDHQQIFAGFRCAKDVDA